MPPSAAGRPFTRAVDTRAAGRILLVKAIEETRAAEIAPDRAIDAITAAGEVSEPLAWLDRRAGSLLQSDLADYAPLLALGRPLGGGVALLMAFAFVAGLFTNLLDPRLATHVLFNPVMLLVLWNVAIYALLALRGVLPGPSKIVFRLAGSLRKVRVERDPDPEAPPRLGGMPLLARPLISLAWWVRQKLAVKATRARHAGRVVWNFAPDWIEAAWPRVSLLARRALALASIGIVLGAFAGMYVRGLGFEYNVVWRSTFITDPDTIHAILRAVFAPAAWLLGVAPPDATVTRGLMTAQGLPAGPWIHLYAVIATGLVLLPRALIALVYSLRLRFRRSRLRLDLSDPYFRELLVRAQRYQIEKVTREIRSIVERETVKLADGVSRFAVDALYDKRIVPRLREFRESGGRLGELKSDLEARCSAFEPELQSYLEGAREAFESQVASQIQGMLQIDLTSPETSAGRLGASIRSAAGRSAAGVGGSMGTSLTDPVAMAVSSAVALVAGSVSGGFGAKLGTALLVGLGTTGPVGFLIGAVAGLVAAGGAYLIGRDRVAASIEQVQLPAGVVRTIVWEKKLERMIDEGRERCRAQVREQLVRQLEPLPARLSAEIWTRIKPVLGEELLAALPHAEPSGGDRSS